MPKAINQLKQAGYRVVYGNTWHRLHGSLGGEDSNVPLLTDGKPTQLLAQASGWMTSPPSKFKTLYIQPTNTLDAFVYEECKSFIGRVPRKVEIGEPIAIVGLVRPDSKGRPIARFPHQHAVRAGKRITVGALVAIYARQNAKARKAQRKAEVKRIAAELNRCAAIFGMRKTAASRNGSPGRYYYKLEQRYGRENGLYAGKITGINTPATRAVDAHLAALTAS
jgi:hypothetical protein